jgi:hypothetical protein
MTFRRAMAVAAAAGVLLGGAGAAGAAPHAKKPVAKKVAAKKVLKRAFATRTSGSEIQHWTVHTDAPDIPIEYTEDLYLHVTDAGLVDKRSTSCGSTAPTRAWRSSPRSRTASAT